MRGITDAQAINCKGAVFVGIGCDIDVAVVEVVVGVVPVSAFVVSDGACMARGDGSRLVKADTVCQHLKRRLLAISTTANTRLAELHADVVDARSCCVPCQGNV